MNLTVADDVCKNPCRQEDQELRIKPETSRFENYDINTGSQNICITIKKV